MAIETEATVQGIDLSDEQDGGIVKEILTEGTGDEKPAKGDRVTVHYVGTLLDGTKFDSSRDRGEKFTFTLGKGEVIKAWDKGVASMRKGEVAKLTCKAEYAYGEQGSPPKIPPGATLLFEVELFSWQGEDITKNKDGGIIRSLLKEGTGYLTPNDFAKVTIKYSAQHNGAVVFEETTSSFVLGEVEDPKICSGLEMAVRKMKDKEHSRFTVAPAYAFGKEGNSSLGVPSDATLVFDVELQSFEKGKRAYDMDTKEKLDQAQIRKDKGTDLFKKDLLEKAKINYSTVLDYLDGETLDGEEKEKRDALVLAARLNLAACELKLGDDAKVIEHCNEALQLSENNTKAYFRRAKAYQNRKDFELAVKDYEKVVSLEPENKAAKNSIIVCRKNLQAEHEQEKKLYKNMFSKMTSQTATKKTEELSEDSVFKNGVGEWSNDMAAGMMPLDQEEAAFGEAVHELPGNNGNNHRH
ncbi:peptidylprolyl isomerase [Plakobranchus ocellatus]|uniref:peptidylprolyl isomerase n=1 Tax=Plakobranchus ocellatus TaxID=259542 RepID=A0AAV3Y1I6_9GAST|nr:peptidylprolyl isomerase [Plakobranchus ocellatus]